MRTVMLIFLTLLTLQGVYATSITGFDENSTFATNLLSIDTVNSRVGILTSSATQKFDVQGTINATQYINATTNICINGSLCLSDGAGTNIWTNTSGNLSILNARVGIGTTNPDVFTLQVNGSIVPNATESYALGGWIQPNQTNNLSLANASWFGESGSGQLGINTKVVGDVNGDGIDDLVLSAYLNSDFASNTGQIYLLFGKEDGWTINNNITEVANASWYGEGSGDWLGATLGRVGDVNADGYDDFIVSAYQNDESGNTAGQVYLILGRENGWSTDNNISTTANASWNGVAFTSLGLGLGDCGDVNGDGYDDIMIGASQSAGGGAQRGTTYLILGKATGWDMDQGILTADTYWNGEANNDFSGNAYNCEGDVNNDGYDDILIAANQNDEGTGTNQNGQVYLILGKASGWSGPKSLGTDSNASWRGESANSYLGQGVVSNFDFNADGYDDILMSAYLNSEASSLAGQTYLVLGKANGWSMDNDVASVANASWQGDVSSSRSGQYIASPGDINADGYDDILIGTSASNGGYMVLGGNNVWTMDTSLSSANNTWRRESVSTDGAGAVVEGGDINGDGYADYLISAGGYNSSLGKVYAIISQKREFLSTQVNVGNISNIATITNKAAFVNQTIKFDEEVLIDTSIMQLTGTVNSSLGINASRHVNATTDICVIGGNCLSTVPTLWTNTSNNFSSNYGNIGIGITTPTFKLEVAGDIGANTSQITMLGGVDEFGLNNNISNSSASWYGEAASDNSGIVANAGDVNGDGYDDIIIGAKGNDEFGSNSGKAYLIFGKANGWNADVNISNANASWYGERTNEQLGREVARTGDVNGDGYDDILINSVNDAYLIFGRKDGWSTDNNISTNANASFVYQTMKLQPNWLGDFNGDGYDDIMLGGTPTEVSEIHLILGNESGWTMDMNVDEINDTTGGAVFGGIRAMQAGDVNGDGYDDLLTTGSYFIVSTTTFIQLYFGGPSLPIQIGPSDGYSNVTWYGTSTSIMGAKGVGDVNADGYDDIIISDYNNDEGATNAGKAYLILGHAKTWESYGTEEDDNNGSWYGETAYDLLGREISGFSDINGDGYDDFFISASNSSENGENSGKVYLILGNENLWESNTSISTVTNATWYGEEENDGLGNNSFSTDGDYNNDGYTDILIGATTNDEQGSNAGKTYLILNRPKVFSEFHSQNVFIGGQFETGDLLFNEKEFSSTHNLNISANTVNATWSARSENIRASSYVNVTNDICIIGGTCLGSAGTHWLVTNGNTTYSNGRVGMRTNRTEFMLTLGGNIAPNESATYTFGSASKSFGNIKTQQMRSSEIRVGEELIINDSGIVAPTILKMNASKTSVDGAVVLSNAGRLRGTSTCFIIESPGQTSTYEVCD